YSGVEGDDVATITDDMDNEMPRPARGRELGP
ncbi:MAG: hypothetical protein QOF87_3801, partial [Pseudonocardiales bacterium]|nr:hypothetical protein [Pseudonocardiales bacterium]